MRLGLLFKYGNESHILVGGRVGGLTYIILEIGMVDRHKLNKKLEHVKCLRFATS